jgi:hypothetical protein
MIVGMAELLSTRKMLSGAALSLVLAGCAENSTPADQSTPEHTGDQIGYDVSWPQGDRGLTPPKDALFTIVGLNHDIANDWNPYFGDQFAQAQNGEGAGDIPAASIYVHTANPGSKVASKWPDSGKNRYGTCQGDDSLACDYEYGKLLATGDLTEGAKYDAQDAMVWLDIEKENYSWQTGPKGPDRNRAALEGMVKAFRDHGNDVGLYSSAAAMQEIAGELPADSELNGLPNWVLGAGNLTEARANCRSAGFGGQVVLAQLAGDKYPIDRNLVC